MRVDFLDPSAGIRYLGPRTRTGGAEVVAGVAASTAPTGVSETVAGGACSSGTAISPLRESVVGPEVGFSVVRAASTSGAAGGPASFWAVASASGALAFLLPRFLVPAAGLTFSLVRVVRISAGVVVALVIASSGAAVFLLTLRLGGATASFGAARFLEATGALPL